MGVGGLGVGGGGVAVKVATKGSTVSVGAGWTIPAAMVDTNEVKVGLGVGSRQAGTFNAGMWQAIISSRVRLMIGQPGMRSLRATLLSCLLKRFNLYPPTQRRPIRLPADQQSGLFRALKVKIEYAGV